MGSQSFQLGDLVGLEGPAVLVGRVDSSASPQVGQEESMGAILAVHMTGHLVDPEGGHPMDPEMGRLVDPEADRPVVLEVGRLEDQGVHSSDRHRNLGQNRTLG